MIFSERDQFFMRAAIREASRAFDEEECPIGAVVVHNNEIIGRGHNQTRRLKDPTAHAEMIALTAAAATLSDERLNECALYVTLEPCIMCAGALVHARIKTIFFGAFEPKTGACGSLYNIPGDKRLNHEIKVFSGLMEQESQMLLYDFFRSKRDKNQNF
jgi:tRNA(adenine34) deaminase